MKKMLTVFLLVFAASAFGHGGEDHGAPSIPVDHQGKAPPRAAASTELFEVLAALEAGRLVIYVDHYASNEAVTAAKVEVEGAGVNAAASESAPGTYVLALAPNLPPARYPLTISVETANAVDLLSATLDTTASASTPAAHVHDWREWLLWLVATLLLLAAAALLRVRRHRKSKGH